MNIKNFSPLIFLASLGAGGIAIMPFVLMQYTLEHGEGLITRAALWANPLTTGQAVYYTSLEIIMVLFTILHLALTVWFGIKLFKWMKTKKYKTLMNDPLKNTALLTPLISILMTLNVMIGSIRYFIPALSDNFQSLFWPAMVVWSLLFIFVMYVEIKLLGISFRKGFDLSQISFGWLLHPFLLGMLTVVGTGIAAMTQNGTIANLAAFMSLISGTMGVFLLLVKMIVLFKSHFEAKGLPSKQFLPGFLIVIPNITLFALSAFRFGHFLEHHHEFHLGAYFYLVVGVAFAFEVWYFLFGLSLLRDYFKQHHFKEFYLTQWGFICPLVAFVVLGSFVAKFVLPYYLFYLVLAVVIFIAVAFYIELLVKHIKCSRNKSRNLSCEF
jgi:hypothetical protein